MAPSSLPAGAAAQQDALDVKINTAVFGFALAAGGLVVLGAVAYVCFLVVGRTRRQHLAAEEQRASLAAHPPRELVLPAKVEGAARAPRRMILSPLFQLPVYDLEDPDKGQGAFAEHVGHSWRASLHAMGVAGGVHVRHTVTIAEEDDDDLPLAARQAALKSPRSPRSCSEDASVDSSVDSPVVTTPPAAYELPASAYHPPQTKIVEVIQSRGSSPDIVVEDYAPHLRPCVSASSSVGSSTADDTLLRVPPMSWNAPREEIASTAPVVLSTPKQVKKKSSMKKLVSALGDISNAVRLRPELPRKGTKLGMERSLSPRRKENSV